MIRERKRERQRERERDSWGKALTQLEDLHALANDNEPGTEETGLDIVEKNKGGKSKLLHLKDAYIRNSGWYKFSIGLNIDSANFRFPFSTRCILSKRKRSGLSEPCETVQQLS